MPRLNLPAVFCLPVCWLLVASIVPKVVLAQEPATAPGQSTVEFKADEIEFFEREVRPLLVKRCYECHGDVGDELRGGLRLDSREGVLKGGDTGPSIDLENLDKSLFLDAIRYGETYQMPPKSKLPAEEIAIFEKWILAKAPWPAEAKSAAESATKKFDLLARKADHWAWQKVRAPAIPEVKDQNWARSAIDRFVLSKLEQAKLQPSSDADRRVLIRRLYYDLVGLPPPPARVEAFRKENDPHAVERLVDELLKSPQFGERWGRHWLDVVAYAETRGHEFDYDIPGAMIYRDYVIRSLNEDLPFDQFTLEHIAGDMIERTDSKKAHESAIATGFWFLGEWLHSPVDIRKDEADRFDRMIDVYSKAFLGMTVSCARCHDHKFDAISQEDYYALSGYLQGMEYRQYRYETNHLERQAAEEIDKAHSELQPKLRTFAGRAILKAVEEARPYVTAALALEDSAESAELDSTQLAAWKKELLGAKMRAKAVAAPAAATAPRIVEAFSDPGAALLQDGFAFGLRAHAAGEVLLSKSPARPLGEVREFGAASFQSAFSRLSLEAKSVRDFGTLGSTVRSGKTLRTKTFELEKPVLYYLVRGAGRAFAAVDSHRAVAGPLHASLVNAFGAEQNGSWRWVRHELKDYVGHNLCVEFSPDSEADFEVAMVVESDAPPFSLTDGLAPWRELAPEEFQRTVSTTLEAWMKLPSRRALPAEDARLLNQIVTRADLFPIRENADAELQQQISAFSEIEQRWLARLAAPSPTTVSAMEGDVVDDNLLVRGNARVRGAKAPRSFLTALREETQGAENRATRLGLAKSTISEGNPLFSRVAVNRVWHHLFGRGIVPTVDNFGVLGLPPSHPELLDFLAQEFVNDGYSIKRLIKRIVLSRTYQQASQHRAEGDVVDPNNLLLHRMNLRRRDAEGIRDGILALSGRLDLQPPANESIPVHLTPYMEGRGRPAASGPLDGGGKRSIYLAVRRNFLSPLLTVFDFPAPAAPFGARNQSNVPAQALSLLNDPFVHDQAKVWATSVLKRPGSFSDRVDQIYGQALSRQPTAAEVEAWSEFYRKEAELVGAAVDEKQDDARIWLDMCHLMFNSKEFLFVE